MSYNSEINVIIFSQFYINQKHLFNISVIVLIHILASGYNFIKYTKIGPQSYINHCVFLYFTKYVYNASERALSIKYIFIIAAMIL